MAFSCRIKLLLVCLAGSLSYVLSWWEKKNTENKKPKLVTLYQFLKLGRGLFTNPKTWAPRIQSSRLRSGHLPHVQPEPYLQWWTIGSLKTIPWQGGPPTSGNKVLIFLGATSPDTMTLKKLLPLNWNLFAGNVYSLVLDSFSEVLRTFYSAIQWCEGHVM